MPNWIHLTRESLAVLRGYLQYRRTGETSEAVRDSLTRLFVETEGRSHLLLHQLNQLARRRCAIASREGVLGLSSRASLDSFARRMDVEGYHLFRARLAPEICRKLVDFALTTECRPRGSAAPALFPRGKPQAPSYEFTEGQCLQVPEIQALAADRSLLTAAQAYLHCAPVLSGVSLAWTTPLAPDAPLFHFFPETIKGISFFFYLTEVGEENGPHWFVARSHTPWGKPEEIVRDAGWSAAEEELRHHFPDEGFVPLTGPAGTVFAEDTGGFHRNVAPRSGDRLCLRLSFCDTLFGTALPPLTVRLPPDSPLRLAHRDFPSIYARYRIGDPLAETSRAIRNPA